MKVIFAGCQVFAMSEEATPGGRTLSLFSASIVKQERIDSDEESVNGAPTDHPAAQASPTSSTQAGLPRTSSQSGRLDAVAKFAMGKLLILSCMSFSIEFI